MDRLSYPEYLEIEAQAEERHLLWDGEMFAMSGGSDAHTILEANLVRLLGNALVGQPCRAYTGNRRLRSLEASDRAVYPDAVVICGLFAPHPEDARAATNPTLVFEVLSDSTEAFDRGKKFAYYRTFPTLRAYVLLSQSAVALDLFRRDAGGAWSFTTVSAGQPLELPELDVRLSLEQLYEGIISPEHSLRSTESPG